MDNKEKRQHIKKLKKEKQYDKIYEIYGQKEFRKNVPSDYMNNEIYEFMKEGKYEDIVLKYGKKEYNKIVNKLKRIKYEDELFKTLVKMKTKFIYVASNFLYDTIFFQLRNELIEYYMKELVYKDEIYSKQYTKYNERMQPYIEYLRKLELNDKQLIMKIISDMWEDIDGYQLPNDDILLYSRIVFAQKNAIGVCRNMADHFTHIINEVNPEYNARNFFTSIDQNAKISISDIDINVIMTSEEYQDLLEIYDGNKKYGNHCITLLKIPKENYFLVIDSTNPSIGIYTQNEIKIFSNIEVESKNSFYDNFKYRGKHSFGITIIEILKSYKNNKNFDELERQWGLEEQNKALEEIRQMNLEGIQTCYENSIKENSNDKFKNKYKVKTSNLNKEYKDNKNIEVEEKQMEYER